MKGLKSKKVLVYWPILENILDNKLPSILISVEKTHTDNWITLLKPHLLPCPKFVSKIMISKFMCKKIHRYNFRILILIYRVINLRMPKSKPLLSHYLLSEHVFILGVFNQFSAYILIFEIRFLIFQNFFIGPKWWYF